MFGNFAANSNTTNPGTTGGLFGGQNTNQGAGSSLFGGTNTNTNPLQAQPTQPSLFGGSNNNTGGGGPFGSTNTNTTQNATGTAGGGLFGSNTNPPPTGGGGGLLGNQSTPGTGGSLFGNATNTANTNTGATGGLFANPNTAGTGSSLFGNAAQATQQGLNNSLFGGPGNAPTTTGTTGGGLFGAGNTNTNTGGGFFGANTNTQQAGQTTGGGLFGGQAAGSSLFGAKPGGLFGSTTTNPQQQQQPQTQQQSTLFGSMNGNLFGGGGNQSTLGTSAFGAPAQPNTGLGASTLAAPNNLLASRSMAASQQQSADPQVQYATLVAKIEGIQNAWNPGSRDCRFQYNFYNLVDPKQVSLYGRPPNATNDALWEKAVRENPNPSCLVPVIGVGFDDLRLRIDAQTAQSASHIQKLNDLQQRLAALRTQHSVNNASRLLRAASTQTQLIQRVMRFAQHLHLLIPAIRSSALRPEEDALRGKLEELEEEMRRGRVKSRLNELWALIGAVGAGIERAGGPGAQGEWAVVDEEGLGQIAQILAEQQVGLQLLTKIAQKAQKDLNVIMGKSSDNKEAEDSGYPGDGGETLWGSTSMLRASSLR